MPDVQWLRNRQLFGSEQIGEMRGAKKAPSDEPFHRHDLWREIRDSTGGCCPSSVRLSSSLFRYPILAFSVMFQ